MFNYCPQNTNYNIFKINFLWKIYSYKPNPLPCVRFGYYIISTFIQNIIGRIAKSSFVIFKVQEYLVLHVQKPFLYVQIAVLHL